MVREVPLREALDEILPLVMQFMGADSCLLYIIDGGGLVLYASHGEAGENVGKLRLKLGEGLTGWVALEQRLLAITSEAYADPRFRPFPELPADAFEAFLAVPVMNRGGVAGVLNVQHRKAHQHTGSEMEMLATVGEQLGCLLALEQAAGRLELSDDLPLEPAPVAGTTRT